MNSDSASIFHLRRKKNFKKGYESWINVDNSNTFSKWCTDKTSKNDINSCVSLGPSTCWIEHNCNDEVPYICERPMFIEKEKIYTNLFCDGKLYYKSGYYGRDDISCLKFYDFIFVDITSEDELCRVWNDEGYLVDVNDQPEHKQEWIIENKYGNEFTVCEYFYPEETEEKNVHTNDVPCNGTNEVYAFDKCVKLFEEQVNWETAREECRKWHPYGSLVSLPDDNFSKFIDERFEGIFWIGMTLNWEGWDNGESIDYEKWIFDDEIGNTCIARHYGYQIAHCDEKNIFVCERPFIETKEEKRISSTKVPCDDGMLIHGNCVKYFTGVSSSYNDAEIACKVWNGYSSLVSIQNKEKNDLIQLFDIKNEAWIGFNDVTGLGDWEWKDGEEPNYTNWIPGKIGDNSDENCAIIQDGYSWNDANCDLSYNYICERPFIRSTAIPCNGDNELISYDRCLKYYHDSPATWSNAQKQCKSWHIDGELITIDNEAKQIQIKNMISDNTIWSNDDAATYRYNEEVLYDFVCERRFVESEFEKKLFSSRVPCETETSSEFVYDDICIKRVDLNLNWNEARDWCHSWNDYGSLLSISSTGLDSFVKQLAKYDTYVGLNDISENDEEINRCVELIEKERDLDVVEIVVEDEWYWENGIVSEYRGWSPGKPDNEQNHCVGVLGDSSGWNDFNCDDKLFFFCGRHFIDSETEIERLISSTKVPCDGENERLIRNKCVKYFKGDPKSWIEAKNECKAWSRYGALLTMENHEISLIINQIIDGDIWIGLNIIKSEGNFVWDSGMSVTHTQWLPGEPNNWDGNQNCAIYKQSPKQWSDCNCYYKLGQFMCERPIIPKLTCNGKNEKIFEDESCLKSFKSSKKSYFNAEIDCFSWGTNSHLVDIQNERKNSLVRSMISDWAFIGLTDIENETRDTEGIWKWTTGLVSNWFSWGPGEPNNLGEEDCVTIATSGLWNDISCDRIHDYVCEMDLINTLEDPFDYYSKVYESSLYPCGNLDSNELVFDKKCIKKVEIKLNWNEAVNWCNDWNEHGSLLTINSYDMDVLAKQFITENTFIGLSLNSESNTWKWNDNLTSNYEGWAPNKPDNSLNKCVGSLGDKSGWNDFNCDDELFFMCSRPFERKNKHNNVEHVFSSDVMIEGIENYGSGFYSNMKVTKQSGGDTVYLSGFLRITDSSKSIGAFAITIRLPYEFRPSRMIHAYAATNNGWAVIRIYRNGDVNVYGGRDSNGVIISSSTLYWVSFEGLSFRSSLSQIPVHSIENNGGYYNGYYNYNSLPDSDIFAEPGFYKDENGIVHLIGLLRNTRFLDSSIADSLKIITYLPEGFRPTRVLHFHLVSHSGAMLRIWPSGAVDIWSTPTGYLDWVSLDNIFFGVDNVKHVVWDAQLTGLLNFNGYLNPLFSYSKVGSLVIIEGMVKRHTGFDPKVVFTLPEGYRPSRDLYFALRTHHGVTQLLIKPDGVMEFIKINNSIDEWEHWISFNGVSYFVDED